MLVRLLLILLISNLTASSQAITERLLITNWRFQCEDSLSIEGKAQVPGTIYTDLERNRFIKHPFWGSEELKMGWIAEKNWIYSTQFNLSPQEIASKTLWLKFESIDTHAEVVLNGRTILQTDNQFREWMVDIRPFIKAKTSQTLEIRLKSNLVIARQKAAELHLTLPGGEAPWIRKVQHHFGWDWSPRLPAGGITGNITLIRNQRPQAENLCVQTLSLRNDTAWLQLEFELTQPFKQTQTISWSIQGKPGSFRGQVKAGTKTVQLPFTIIGIEPWWSHDQGQPKRYELQLKLTPQSSLQLQKFGIRTIELVQEKDRWGKSFYFRLNGRPVFAKGANMVPMHVFLPEIKPADYEKLISRAKSAGFNMIRIWGGGTYGSEAFYEICNREGIMVWQDFMFACAMYPSDTAFLSTVKEEVRQQVLRLRKHPSLAVWCGNNEIDEAWHNWGWQKQYRYSPEDSSKLWQGYQQLFHQLIPQIIAKYDGKRPYHPSSPTTGWGRKNSLYEGDLHYWGVWWGKEPLGMYRQKTGRFVSEYGFQSLPAPSSLLPWLPENPLSKDSIAFKNHQKHPFGFEAIQKVMDETLPSAKNPSDFSEYVYRTQIVQAKALEAATNAHLLAFPRCMGTLFWQFNDCWPVASWSILDHLYQAKPAFTTIKQAFNPVRLLVDSFPQDSLEAGPQIGQADGLLRVYLLNTGATKISGQVQIDWIDFQGKILSSNLLIAQAKSGEKQFLGAFPRPSDSLAAKTCWVLRFKTDGVQTSNERELYFFQPDKNLTLPKATVYTQQLPEEQILTVTAGASLIRNLWIEQMGVSDATLYQLLPGEQVRIPWKKERNEANYKLWFINPE